MEPLVKVVTMAVQTMRQPREIARQIMALEMERRQRWEVFTLAVLLSAIFAYLSIALSIVTGDEVMVQLTDATPILLAVSQAVVMLATVGAIEVIGKRFGGTGTLDDAILLVAWVQLVLVVLQIAQIAAVVILPPLAFALGIAGVVMLFVMLTVFVAEMHGFKSLMTVFFMVLFVMFIIATLLRFLFSVLGLNMVGVI